MKKMLTPTLWNTFVTIFSITSLLKSMSSSNTPETIIIIKDIVNKNRISALLFRPDPFVLPILSPKTAKRYFKGPGVIAVA